MSNPKEAQSTSDLAVSQPPPLQLVFGVDDDGSETSVTSPYVTTEEDSTNPLTGYLPTTSSNESSTHRNGELQLHDDQAETESVITSTSEKGKSFKETSEHDSVANAVEGALQLNTDKERNEIKRTDVKHPNIVGETHHHNETLPTSPSNETPPISPTVTLSPDLFKTHSQDGVFFNGIHYLGSSTVDAPVSETEANRKMSVLKTQAGQPIPIILQIPHNNQGDIMLKDPSTNQILTAFPIRHVLFCARGNIDSSLNDCLALNVVHKRSGVYHCHVFLCEIPEAVSSAIIVTEQM